MLNLSSVYSRQGSFVQKSQPSHTSSRGALGLTQLLRIDSHILSRYKQFSILFYTALMGFADDLQAVSVDEALIEATQKLKEYKSRPRYGKSSGDPAKDFAEAIRDEVRKATSCEGDQYSSFFL